MAMAMKMMMKQLKWFAPYNLVTHTHMSSRVVLNSSSFGSKCNFDYFTQAHQSSEFHPVVRLSLDN